MKVLLSISVLLALVLTSCANIIPASIQESTPTAPASVQSTEENASPETSSGNAIEIVGGDEESLREFIRQWVGPISPDSTSQNITVYIGSLPKEIPYDLPMPDDAHVVGSITGSWVDYMFLFDTSLSPDAAHEFYTQALEDKGWQQAPTGPGQGFTSGTNVYRAYCYAENEAYLSLETLSGSAEKTSIRLSLDTSPDSYVCNANPNMGSDYVRLIPELRAPKGVMVQGGGAGSSDRDANISANLKGDISAAEAVDLYNEQLLAAGWNMQNAGEGEGAAWSRWTFKDEDGNDWIGALMVVEVSTESDALFAFVTIERSK